jgi:uncharacterized protein (DUF433 family)
MTAEEPREPESYYRVPGIVLAEGPAGPRARIAGTGIEVFEVIGPYLSMDRDAKRLRKRFHWLSPEQLRAALTYYERYRDEIDERLQREDEVDPEEIRRLVQARYGASPRR